MSDKDTLQSPTLPAGQPAAIGPYPIVRELGRGGMGTVYLAQDPALDRTVVVKVLHSFLESDPVFIRRFVQEANSAAAVNHPAVIRIIKIDVETKPPYIVMEYFEGEALSERIKREGALPVPFGLMVARNVALGLREAARRGLVHRDIKPSNILVDREGFVKLVDFGIAKSVERDLHLTQTGEVIGTPYYMAPETLKTGRSDFRSDMYSLGVTLYSCFVGRYPYDVRSAAELAVRLHTEPQPDPAIARPDLPETTSAIIRKLMAVDPAERYPDYDALVSAIDTAVTEPRPVVLQPVPRPWLRPALYSAAALAVVGLTAAVYFALKPPAQQGNNAPQPTAAQQEPPPTAPSQPMMEHAAEPDVDATTATVQPKQPAGQQDQTRPPVDAVRPAPVTPPPAPPPPAVESTSPPRVNTYQCDFSQREARLDWVAIPMKTPGIPPAGIVDDRRSWVWDNGRLIGDPTTRLVLKRIVHGDLNLTATVEFDEQETGSIGFVLFGAPREQRGYTVVIRPPDALITKSYAGQRIQLDRRSIDRVSGRSTVTCSIRGPTISIALNGKTVAEATDSEFRDGYISLLSPAGGASVYRIDIQAEAIEDVPSLGPGRPLRPGLAERTTPRGDRRDGHV